MADTLQLAVWQCPSQPLDVAGNLQRLDAQAALAAADGAQLLVCPEMFLTGYDIGADAVRRLAEPGDGPSSRMVAEIARRHRIAIAWGHPERAGDGRIHNAARLCGPDGAWLAGCRKTHLFGALDRGMFSAGSGDEALATLHGWRIGLAICYDIEFPETARRLALAGADLIVVPTANMADYDVVADTLLPARALESQVYLAYANYCGHEGRQHYGGLSCVLAPDAQGPVVAGRAPTLLRATLSRDRLSRSRSRFPYLADLRSAG